MSHNLDMVRIQAVTSLCECTGQGCPDWDAAIVEIGRQLAEKLDAKVTEPHESDECVYDTAAALVREWCGLTQDN